MSGKRSPEEWGASVGTFWLPIHSVLGCGGGGVDDGKVLLDI
jgi:hypothetical protein